MTQCEPQDTLMFKSGTDFREMSLISMEVGGPGKPRVKHERIKITSEIPDDPETAAIVAHYLELVRLPP